MYAFFRLIDQVLYPVRMIGYYAGRLVPGLRRVTNLSSAAQGALIAFVFFVVVLVFAVVFDSYADKPIIWGKLPWLVGVTIACPIVLYYAIVLLMTPTHSLYPDIDTAWNAGMSALDEQGFGIDDLPLFLVIGAGNADRVSAVFQGSGMELELDGVLKGAAPLRWYATETAIYLCCPTIGVIARLIESANNRAPASRSSASVRRPTETAAAFDQTLQAPNAYDDLEALDGPVSPVAAVAGMGRTIDLEDVLGDTSTKQRPENAASQRTGALSASEVREQRERLSYLCQLLRRERSPVCPVNGILTLLPFHSLLLADMHTESAVQDDMATLCRELEIRCTSVVLVTDMEREPGFIELMRRIGSQLTAAGGFGKGFDHRTVPTKERMDALVQHACGAFEDWTHKLFSDPGALDKPGNGQLFATMCKVRGRFRKIFSSAITNGFGCDSRDEGESPVMFGGCYFAATGEKAGTRGFISRAFTKLAHVEDDLEWVESALARDDRCRAIANITVLVGVLALGFMVGSLWIWRTGLTGG